MGYTTNFNGELQLNRPLTHQEWLELKQLANYEKAVYEAYTETPDTIPDSYLQWEPNESGTAIVWNGEEKFYDYIHWLRWLIKHYMKPHDLVLNGILHWQGEDMKDRGVLMAQDNRVTTRKLIVEGLVACPNCDHEFVPNA